MSKLLKLFVTGLSSVMLLICCAAWLLFSLPAFGWQALVVPTHSMEPSVPAGSLVLVHRVPVSSLRVGDIVTYANPRDARKTITHRIISIRPIGARALGFTTRGDANKVADISIAGGSIQGKAVGHMPYAGTILAWVRSWVGIAVLVYLPSLLIMIEEVKRLSVYYKLALPYRLAGYRRAVEEAKIDRRVWAVPVTSVALIVLLIAVWQPIALEVTHSNTVVLAHNRLSVAHTTCHSGNSTNNITVNDSTTQTASSGSASGGSANSGTASNSNSTDINVTITNHC